jgi:hypothetical protein
VVSGVLETAEVQLLQVCAPRELVLKLLDELRKLLLERLVVFVAVRRADAAAWRQGVVVLADFRQRLLRNGEDADRAILIGIVELVEGLSDPASCLSLSSGADRRQSYHACRGLQSCAGPLCAPLR